MRKKRKLFIGTGSEIKYRASNVLWWARGKGLENIALEMERVVLLIEKHEEADFLKEPTK
jgi:hypothetical protein